MAKLTAGGRPVLVSIVCYAVEEEDVEAELGVGGLRQRSGWDVEGHSVLMRADPVGNVAE